MNNVRTNRNSRGQEYLPGPVFRTLGIGLILILLMSGCDWNGEEGNGIVFWEKLSSYHELGRLTKEEIGESYPTLFQAVLHYDVTVYRVVYNTRTTDGETVQASGVILLPQNVEEHQVLNLNRSAIFHEDEAPSNVDLGNPDFRNMFWGNLAPIVASSGMIVIMPDLLGWGQSSDLFHPFMIPASDELVAFDMLVASQELLETEDVEWKGDLFLAGYSQGATTATALLKAIQNDSQNRFDVTRASVGGGVLNPEGVVEAILEREEMSAPQMYAFSLKAYRNTYFPDIPLSTLFNSPYDLIIVQDQLFRGGFRGSEIAERLPGQTGELIFQFFRNQFLAGSEQLLRSALIENDLTDFEVRVPFRIYHGGMDEVIPIDEAVRAFDRLDQFDPSQMELYIVEEGDHLSTAETYFLETFFWFMQDPGFKKIAEDLPKLPIRTEALLNDR